MRSKKRIEALTRYVLLTAAALAFLLPFAWMAAGSLKTLSGYYERPVSFFFANPNWSNYAFVFQKIGLVRHTANSVLVAGSVAALQLVTSSFAAFAFSMLSFPGKKALFAVVMSTMMVPACVMLVPLFIITQRLGMINSYLAMIVPFMFSGFGIFLMRQAYLGLPRDLFSAAEIDGAGYFTIFSRIYAPLSVPSMMSLVTITFIQYFNSILWPQIVISSESKTVLAVRMISMVSFDRLMEPPKIMATAAVCIIPPLVVFASLQRFFVKGYTLSGLKG